MKKIATLKPKEEKKLLKIAKQGTGEKKKNAIRLLLHHNQNLVKYLAIGYSYFNKQVEYEDLVAEGTISLLKAIEKFDLSSKGRFATYAGFWIKQYFQSFINKSQIINQSSTVKEKKKIIFYDSSYQNEDNENKSYSLSETLYDSEGAAKDTEQIRQRDITIQINNLINSLGNHEEILLTRLLHKIAPSNLLDIYYITTEEEKKELKKKMKLGNKDNLELLQEYSLEEKKNNSLSVVKKYSSLFSQSYKFSEIAKLLKKSENSTRKLKLDTFKKLQKLAKERNFFFLTKQ